MTSGPRPLKDLLGAASPLGRLKEAVDRRLELCDYLRCGLPEPLRPAMLTCNLREDGTLVVTTPSAVWAARLRFESDSMLGRCRERFPGAARVRVRVKTDGAG